MSSLNKKFEDSVQEVLEERKLARRKIYRVSKLIVFRAEIDYFRSIDVSYETIRWWLSRHHHVRISRVAVYHAVKSWGKSEACLLSESEISILNQQIQRVQCDMRKHKKTRTKRLNRYKEEIICMHNEGKSLTAIQSWLRKKKRFVVARSSLHWHIQKWKVQTHHQLP